MSKPDLKIRYPSRAPTEGVLVTSIERRLEFSGGVLKVKSLARDQSVNTWVGNPDDIENAIKFFEALVEHLKARVE